MAIALTEKAANEIKRVLSEQKLPDNTVLRIGVAGGGCSGFQYALGFDQEVDPVKDQVAWGMELTGHQQYGRNNHEVRPMAFEANADGSTKRMFAQATGINAVWVIDWNKRQVMELGRQFPLQVTFSCIASGDGRHCGRCNKCAERREAFHRSGIPDATVYGFPGN